MDPRPMTRPRTVTNRADLLLVRFEHRQIATRDLYPPGLRVDVVVPVIAHRLGRYWLSGPNPIGTPLCRLWDDGHLLTLHGSHRVLLPGDLPPTLKRCARCDRAHYHRDKET